MKNGELVGYNIKINRMKKWVEAHLYKHENNHYKATWAEKDGMPRMGIVTYPEIEDQIKRDSKLKQQLINAGIINDTEL